MAAGRCHPRRRATAESRHRSCPREGAAALAAGAREAGLDAAAVIETPDRAGALAVLRERLVRGDVVLVKASRGLELDRLADDLLAGLT